MAVLGATTSTANIGLWAVTALTPGTTVTLTVTQGPVFTETAGQNQTINATGTQVAGQRIILIITNDGTSGRTITFGTGFRAASTIVGTISKAATIQFVSDGTSLFEVSRALVL